MEVRVKVELKGLDDEHVVILMSPLSAFPARKFLGKPFRRCTLWANKHRCGQLSRSEDAACKEEAWHLVFLCHSGLGCFALELSGQDSDKLRFSQLIALCRNWEERGGVPHSVSITMAPAHLVLVHGFEHVLAAAMGDSNK